METIEYYNVPADKIGLVLCYLKPYGWLFDTFGGSGDSIDKWYCQSTSRDWDGHQPVFRLKEYKESKMIAITSDLLMRANNQIDVVRPYKELKKKLGIQ